MRSVPSPNLDNKIRTATAKQARTIIDKKAAPGPEAGRANKLAKASFVPAKTFAHEFGRWTCRRARLANGLSAETTGHSNRARELKLNPNQESANGHRRGLRRPGVSGLK
jgi:hypothetical protein